MSVSPQCKVVARKQKAPAIPGLFVLFWSVAVHQSDHGFFSIASNNSSTGHHLLKGILCAGLP